MGFSEEGVVGHHQQDEGRRQIPEPSGRAQHEQAGGSAILPADEGHNPEQERGRFEH